LAVAGATILIVIASKLGDPWKVVSFSVYSATLILLYTFSTLYHSLRGRAKALFRRLDHSAIYLLIAGTWTPFALVTLRGDWGWPMFGAAWSMALVGVVQELWTRSSRRLLSLVLYVLMGWMAVVVTLPLLTALGWAGFAWLLAGGVFYTGGILFYVYDEEWRHAHGIWHLFVMAGSASHFGTILMFVA